MNCTTCWPPNLRKYLLYNWFFWGCKIPTTSNHRNPQIHDIGDGVGNFHTLKTPMKKCCPSRMDGGHQTFNDAKVFVHHLAGVVSKTYRNKTRESWSCDHGNIAVWLYEIPQFWNCGPSWNQMNFSLKSVFLKKLEPHKSCSFRLKLKKSLAWILSKLLQGFSNSKVPFP